jgi:hypothetical protein
VVAIGDTVSVTIVVNSPVVVTSFVFETYPLTCRAGPGRKCLQMFIATSCDAM